MTNLTSFSIDLAQFAMSADAMEFFMENDYYECLGSVEDCAYVGSVMTLSFDLGEVDDAESMEIFRSKFESETAIMVAAAIADSVEG
jgi:hypothetical protein